MDALSKTCNSCGVLKPLTDFYKESRSSDGKRYSCKGCDKIRKRKYLKTEEGRSGRYSSRAKHRMTEREYSSRYRVKNRAKEMVRHAKNRAKRMNIPFTLSAHVDKIQKRLDAGFCELSGLPLNICLGRRYDSPSIHRIEPQKGYTLKNTMVVLLGLNCALGFWGPDTAIKMIDAMKDLSLKKSPKSSSKQ